MHLPESWMAVTSLSILICAALGGALTAYARLAERNTPVDIGLLHGGAGITAALLLFASLFVEETPRPQVLPALQLLAPAILAGLTLYFVIRRRGLLPKSLVLLHALLALGAVHVLARGMPG